jgi:hypothetical protein
MNDDSNKEREKLDSLLERLQWGLEVAGGIVLIGLLVEYGPELADAVTNWRAPPRDAIGGLLIALGVAGEVVLGIFIARSAKRVQTLADSTIAKTLERAAAAEKTAAEANLARVRIEEKFRPRKLDRSTVEQIRTILAPHAGLRIDVFAFDNHVTEVRGLADALNSSFRQAGCASKLRLPSDGRRMPGEAIVFGIANDCSEEEQKKLQSLARSLGVVLSGLSIRSSIFAGFLRGESSVGKSKPASWMRTPWDAEDVAPFRVQVGEKTPLDDWTPPD